jgi:hypothetical protein
MTRDGGECYALSSNDEHESRLFALSERLD